MIGLISSMKDQPFPPLPPQKKAEMKTKRKPSLALCYGGPVCLGKKSHLPAFIGSLFPWAGGAA